MVLAFSYRRFSTVEQAKGDSKRRQEARFQEMVQKHGLEPATVYFDEGKSAWKGDQQKALKKFLDLVKSGQVPRGSWLIVESLDRPSRGGFRRLQTLIWDLVDAGLTLATTSPERLFNEQNIDEPMAVFEIMQIAFRAKEESDRKSERVKEAWSNKLVQAKANGTIATNRGPAWLDWVASDNGSQIRITKKVNERGEWVPIPERAKVVKQIFKWATVNGLGHRAITKRLNASKTAGFKTHRRSGNTWNWSYVALILTDRRVIGEFPSKVGPIADYYPSIIDERTFQKAQALIKKRIRFSGKTSDRISNLFTGLAIDRETKSSMVYVKKGKDIEARWIPSVFETAGKSAGKARSFNYDVFEREFLRLTSELTVRDIGRTDAAPDDEIEELEGQIAKVEVQLEKTKSALTSLAVDPSEGVEVLNTLSNQRKTLTARLDGLKAEKHATLPSDALKQSQSILEQLGKAKGQALVDLRSELRQSIRSLISRIYVKITRVGWQTYLHAQIHFQSGQTRMIFLVTSRSTLLLTAADTEKYREKRPAIVARLAKDEIENYQELVEKLNVQLIEAV